MAELEVGVDEVDDRDESRDGDRIFTSPQLATMIDNSLRWLRDLRER